MNPFSPNYKPVVDMTDVQRDAKISRIRTGQRKAAMQSHDPDVRKQAAGTLAGAPLSKRGGRKA